jgi:lysophospholipase L1-like esterase
MKSRFLSFLLICFIGLTGCPKDKPNNPNPNPDPSCKEGQVLVEGVCVPDILLPPSPTPEPTPPPVPDIDRDGIPDVTDNCPNKWNPIQLDADQDGVGDACEISGTILEKVSLSVLTTDGFPLKNVKVVLYDSNNNEYSSISNTEGKAIFSNVPTGTHTVLVTGLLEFYSDWVGEKEFKEDQTNYEVRRDFSLKNRAWLLFGDSDSTWADPQQWNKSTLHLHLMVNPTMKKFFGDSYKIYNKSEGNTPVTRHSGTNYAFDQVWKGLRDGHNPGIVILRFGRNDTHRLTIASPANVANFEQEYDKIFEEIHNRPQNPVVLIFGLPYEREVQYDSLIDAQNLVMKKVAEKHGDIYVPVPKLNGKNLSYREHPQYFYDRRPDGTPDGIHLNDKGHQALAIAAIPLVLDYFSKGRGDVPVSNPNAAAELEGRLLDKNGAPLVGARVHYYFKGEFIGDSLVIPNGTFNRPGLEERGSYILKVFKDDFLIDEFNIEFDWKYVKRDFVAKYPLYPDPSLPLGISYYSGLSLSLAVIESDFRALREKGVTIPRVWVDWNTKNSDKALIRTDGTIRTQYEDRFKLMIDLAKELGMVIDFTIHGKGLNNYDSHKKAVDNISNLIVKYNGQGVSLVDVSNEFTELRSNQEAADLTNRVKSIDNRIMVTVSSSAGSHVDIAYRYKDLLRRGARLTVYAPHFERGSNWTSDIDDRIREFRGIVGGGIPIYLQEPHRRNWCCGASNTEAKDFYEYFDNAHKQLNSGVWGVCFHTGAMFDSSKGSIFTQFDPVEIVIINNLYKRYL